MIASTLASDKLPRKPRAKNNPTVGKLCWIKAYSNWSDDDFKEKMRLRRHIFNQVLSTIRDQIQLKPLNFNPFPISPDQQLALTIYHLATGCSLATPSGIFGISISSTSVFFNNVCRILVANVNDTYVKLASIDMRQGAEIRGFLEN